jgi:hypothetical protein
MLSCDKSLQTSCIKDRLGVLLHPSHNPREMRERGDDHKNGLPNNRVVKRGKSAYSLPEAECGDQGHSSYTRRLR